MRSHVFSVLAAATESGQLGAALGSIAERRRELEAAEAARAEEALMKQEISKVLVEACRTGGLVQALASLRGPPDGVGEAAPAMVEKELDVDDDVDDETVE
eukprot:CAMPEP_0176308406 /NCGR_PEP_ID=MMETSP0121_2-20121125/64529_1 /TAXON_ID=160619 /ORGANISM="Kryptoperidinium foliaceum, Strain CCMP 1326" /LENGTH=100 /DNA_ID=CAMNT_0017650241 /DNA_START=1 /DNA_END=300 /DNA_ORIENTATION=+